MNEVNTQILVLGGGYAGLMTALRLAGRTKWLPTTITLVNGLDHFVERPRLHEKATGTILPEKDINTMLRGSKIRFLLGWVTEIDPGDQVVHLETKDGLRTEPYDILVYALGSTTDRTAAPGVDKFGYTLDPYGRRTTDELEKRLVELSDKDHHVDDNQAKNRG